MRWGAAWMAGETVPAAGVETDGTIGLIIRTFSIDRPRMDVI